jgi:hypothetical protein
MNQNDIQINNTRNYYKNSDPFNQYLN